MNTKNRSKKFFQLKYVDKFIGETRACYRIHPSFIQYIQTYIGRPQPQWIQVNDLLIFIFFPFILNKKRLVRVIFLFPLTIFLQLPFSFHNS